MLKRQGRQIQATLKALTDPQPEFVSLVFGGANKTPFRAIRADGRAVTEEAPAQEITSKSIARVEFTADKFADETAVKAWLTNGGYDAEMPITKTDTGFMVDSKLDPETVLTVIDMSDTQGIKLYTVAGGSPTLELTEKMSLHPGALIELTMGMYEDVRKSIVEGNYDISGAVADFNSKFSELTTKLPAKDDATFGTAVKAFAPEVEIEKEEIQKAGARNNASDTKTIQQMHDYAVVLGANCGGMSDGNEPIDAQIKADITDGDVPHSNPQPYGNVKYADPKNGKYPIDTAEHIRAAWNYINKGMDSDKYSASELKAVRSRIIAAWKKVIDPAGPPSAQQKEATMSEQKTDEEKVETGETVEKTDVAVESTGTVETAEKKGKKPKPEAEANDGDAEDAEDQADGGDDEAAEGEAPDEDAEEGKKPKKKEEDSAETVEKTDEADPVAALTALVTELTTTVKSMQENLAGEIGKVAERVAAVEETRQTRKGADVDETGTAGPAVTDVSKGLADLRTKNMLGMRRPISKK